MRARRDREVEVLFIFLEHPGGLKPMELWKIVEKRKICARETLGDILDELTASPSPLVKKDDQGNYTLGLVEPLLHIFREGGSEVANQVNTLFQVLYNICDRSDKKQIELCHKIGTLYLQGKVKKSVLTTLLLLPFFYDGKIRKMWLYTQKYVFDTVFEKLDEISKEFYGKEISRELEVSPEMDALLSVMLEKSGKELALINSQIFSLVDQLSTGDDVKDKLKQLVRSEPLLTVYSKEYRTIAKLIRTLEEAQRNLKQR